MLCKTVSAQTGIADLRVLYGPGFSFEKWDTLVPENTKDSLSKALCLLDLHCSACPDKGPGFEKYHAEFKRDNGTKIHFIDLDTDKDFDLVFDGAECKGHEKGNVEIYENTGDSLIQRFKKPGTVVVIDPIKGKLVINNYPCCAQQTNYITEYRFGKLDEPFEAIETRMLVAGRGTHLGGPFVPPAINQKERITFNMEKEVRWSADTTNFDKSGTCKNGDSNLIFTYPAGSTGTVLFITEEHWVFVLMDFNPAFVNACWLEGEAELSKSNEMKVYGWFKL